MPGETYSGFRLSMHMCWNCSSGASYTQESIGGSDIRVVPRGAIAFTRIPVRDRSNASMRVNAKTPPLAPAYDVHFGMLPRTASEAVLTTAPCGAFLRCGQAAFVTATVPR